MLAALVKLWKLGYESFQIDMVAYMTCISVQKLIKSRKETMRSILKMGTVLVELLEISRLKAVEFQEEKGYFNNHYEVEQKAKPDRDDPKLDDKNRSSIFIGIDYVLHKKLALMLE